MFKNIKHLLISGILICLFTATALAQLTTVGPVPPPGTDRGRTNVTRSQVIMPGVPSYLWQHGCGPTAVGMVVGYYDSHGLPDLVAGNATTQNSAVNAMIAADNDQPLCGLTSYSDHYRDYACPIDGEDEILTDRSETGGAHSDNCIADFYLTSRSIYGLGYGWSWWGQAPEAFIDYAHYINPDYNVNAYNIQFYDFTWEEYKSEIDNNLPFCVIVDTDADGQTDHFVTAIGYDDATMEYGIYDTWDNDVHWYPWEEIAPGVVFGVMGVTLFRCQIPEGDTLRVPSQYSTIQDAIDAASISDVILVADGNYTGAGFTDLSFGTEMIYIVSENGPQYTTIDCGGDWPTEHRAFNITDNITSFASIEGFTIKGGVSANGGSAIHFTDADIRVENCIITGNYSPDGATIYCENSSPTIKNCTISMNDGVGIYMDATSSPVLLNTIVWENPPAEIVAENGSNPDVSYSDIHGFFFPSSDCIRENPVFVDPYNGNFNLFEGSPCIDGGEPSNGDADGSRADIGVYFDSHPVYFDAGGTIYVDPTGSDETGDGTLGNPYQTIQQGLRTSRHGDTVIVENGTYNENITFYGHLAYVTSRYYTGGDINDINATVIDGQANGPVVTFNGTENNRAVLHGLTVQNGYTLNGGGIFCAYSSPTVSHCNIVDNTVDQYGGGMYNVYSSPVIEFCLFNGNTAPGNFGFGGAIYAAYGAPLVTNCTSVGNSSYSIGGSIYAYSSDMAVVNTISRMNSSGYMNEIYLSGGASYAIYCNVEGGLAGEGNIDSDPMFCDLGGSDYRLDTSSPCIYSGFGTMMGAFGPGCGSPIGILSLDPREYAPADSGLPNDQINVNLRIYNIGNADLTIDDITVQETSGPAAGWLGLGNAITQPISQGGYFDLDVIVNMNGIIDDSNVPADLKGYLAIDWSGYETQFPVSYMVKDTGYVCECIPGECDGADPINVLDILHLIQYKFKECPEGAGAGSCPAPVPFPICSGDVNCDCSVDILDIIALIDYKFKDGPEPCSCQDWITSCGLPVN